MSNIDVYKNDLDRLLEKGDLVLSEIHKRLTKCEEAANAGKIIKDAKGSFEQDYQSWYTESIVVIRQIIPERLREFEFLYKGDGKHKGFGANNFTIQDWLLGKHPSPFDSHYSDYFKATTYRFSNQLDILKSVVKRFESKLFEIKQLVQADLFDSEIDAAKELLKNGYNRAAGVISGVVLESHLAQVCDNHSVTISKKNSGIGDYNDLLKNNNVIDVPQWRFIQRLGDLRNICGHKKTDDPSKDDVKELIDGVEKITKTLY